MQGVRQGAFYDGNGLGERVSSPTVRDLIRDIQRELLPGDVAPSRARQLLIELTALSGNCSVELRHAEADYNGVLLQQLNGTEKANRASIRAKATPEYARMREASDTFKLVVEMIRSLKVTLRSIEEEMRLAR
jgi:hypothetical protein